MLALGIRYLTGYAVATDVTSRTRAEWPPHPGRVFMAMAAAHFESGASPAERAALEWLERAEQPRLAASDASHRRVVKQFVPVNDRAGPAKMALQCVPALTRRKAERTFPCARPDNDHVYLIWPETNPDDRHREALAKLCRKVTRIGHSSSLVQMWVEKTPPPWNLEPDEEGRDQFRSISEGTLAYLEHQFNGDAIDRFQSLAVEIETSKGSAKRQAREHFEAEFGEQYKKSLLPPQPLRPVISTWQAYRRVTDGVRPAEAVSGAFARDLIVLTIQEGPVIGLESIWQLTTRLHKTVLDTCESTPEWVSGHRDDGRPSTRPHLALLPLAFVSAPHADGHLMGFALAVPRDVRRRERGHALSGLLQDARGLPRDIELRAGRLGRWVLTPELRHSPPRTLDAATWTRDSETWATITPIVLDRHPRAERAKDREAWSREVADIIADSCEMQGLPRPIAVDVDRTSWHRGVPRAVQGKSAGFPLMPVKDGQPRRQQTHAWIRFAEPVAGPLSLGAGRYRGYGFCRPWKRGRA